MDIVLNRVISELAKKQNEIHGMLFRFGSNDFYILVKGSNIFFNEKIQKFLKEKASEDNYVVLDEILVIFSGVEMSVEFRFNLDKKPAKSLENFVVKKGEFNGYAENKFLNGIMGTEENHVGIYKLFYISEPTDKFLKFSLNRFASEVCKPILL